MIVYKSFVLGRLSGPYSRHIRFSHAPITMSTHAAVVTSALRTPLHIIQVPTTAPGEAEVLVRVQFTASTPFDLHQNDGGPGVVVHPQVMGTNLAGTVTELGAGVKNLKVGDKVLHLRLMWELWIRLILRKGIWICMEGTKGESSSRVRHDLSAYSRTCDFPLSHDTIYSITQEYRVPEGFSLEQAVTLTDNFVTVFHAVTADWGINLPRNPKITNPVGHKSLFLYGEALSL